MMQTIEEYKAYTKQLEGDVGKWHHAYDALVIERNQLVNHLKSTEKFLEAEREECDRWRRRSAELEAAIKLHEGESAKMAAKIAELETELELNTETKKGSSK